jgi:hypothetical protein
MRLTSVCGPETVIFVRRSVNRRRNRASSTRPSEPVASFDLTALS